MNNLLPARQNITRRLESALKTAFTADALAMPVHWFYSIHDIQTAFPGGVTQLQPAPGYHPSSIMSLHSTSRGGRGNQQAQQQIIGDVILKGKRQYWGKPNQHYHQQMQAGENTLNAHCARVVMRMLIDNKHHYHKELFLDDYITFMTADPPLHHDTYAESYHRGFFANLQQGRPTDKCGAVTHDTASIGGLVTIAPIVFSERLQATAISEVQHICKQHLYLTHPDAALASICQAYVELLDKLMFRTTQESVPSILAETAKNSIGIDLKAITEKANSDLEVIGGKFSSACYISDSWPSVLYLAYKYHEDLTQALIINTNLGGDNVHRGIILGTILGLANGTWPEHMFNQLLESDSIHAEISALIGQG